MAAIFYLIQIHGNVSYETIHFSYPNLECLEILKSIDLQITTGKTLALVGQSGCGKTTLISLLLRFYEPTRGQISIDGKDIKNLSNLRKALSLVSQEPTLFNRTIAENIAYGALEKSASDDEIVQAAKAANIHNFISTLRQVSFCFVSLIIIK